MSDEFKCEHCGKKIKPSWEEKSSHPQIVWYDIMASLTTLFIAPSGTKGSTGLFCDMKCLKEYLDENYL